MEAQWDIFFRCYPGHVATAYPGIFSPGARGQQAPQRENPRSSRLDFLEIFFLKTLSLDSAARAKNFFVFGCGWWYDREIVLLPPRVKIERDGVLFRVFFRSIHTAA